MYFITEYIRFNSTKQIFQFLEGYPNHDVLSAHEYALLIRYRHIGNLYDPSMTHHIKTKAQFTVRFLHKLHLVFGVKRAILYCRFKLMLAAHFHDVTKCYQIW